MAYCGPIPTAQALMKMIRDEVISSWTGVSIQRYTFKPSVSMAIALANPPIPFWQFLRSTLLPG